MKPRLALVAAVCVVLVTSAGVGSGRARADAAPRLVGWTASADANRFDLVLDTASGLGGSHPLTEAVLPEDNADFETGPYGHALASIFWPGATAGNVGSLSGELPVPPQFAPLLEKLNDPVRAESFFPAGPASAVYPAGAPGGVAEMRSTASEAGVSSSAGLTDVAVPGLFEIKAVAGNSAASADTVAHASASGSVGSISLLGGLIQIGASSSSASASSDGVRVSGTATTHIGTVTVLGQPVNLGTAGGSGTLASDLLSALNLKITLLPQSETRDAPTEKITSGGLRISFGLPPDLKTTLDCGVLPAALSQALSTLCTLPGLFQGASVAITLGQVSATAIGTPPFGSSSEPTAGPAPSTALSSGGDGAVAMPPSGAEVTPGVTGYDEVSPSTEVSPPTPPPVVEPSATALQPIALSSPIKPGLLLFLLLVAAFAGAMLVSLTRALRRPPPTVCPLEEGI